MTVRKTSPESKLNWLNGETDNVAKYIFVTGGVLSALGKGVTAASLGRLLADRKLKVSLQKLDPYLNVDCGTMNPYQHGEVFVTADGAETDLDIGHYERFLDHELSRGCNVTSGQVYQSILTRERRGDYLGETVQVIPHVTDRIKECIKSQAGGKDLDVLIVEVGGTVGDIESLPFLEAAREMKTDLGPDNVLYIHITWVPYLKTAGELKTKPTQHSVNELRRIGIQPDVVVCRAQRRLPAEVKQKISLFCGVPAEAVVEARDVNSVYEVPLLLEKEGLARLVTAKLGFSKEGPELSSWQEIVKRIKHLAKTRERVVNVGILGKYVTLPDSYISVSEAIRHAAWKCGAWPQMSYISSETLLEEGVESVLSALDAVVVPGGFGERGIDGMVEGIRYLREKHRPFLGICLGMQCAVIEVARNVLGWTGANSTEFDPDTAYPVIDLASCQLNIDHKGGTMRLGAYPCRITKDSLVFSLYRKKLVQERHRHRYEFNENCEEQLKKAGLAVSGRCPEGGYVECVEFKKHPYFVGVQYHPEFLSRPDRPHPLFLGLIEAAVR